MVWSSKKSSLSLSFLPPNLHHRRPDGSQQRLQEELQEQFARVNRDIYAIPPEPKLLHVLRVGLGGARPCALACRMSDAGCDGMLVSDGGVFAQGIVGTNASERAVTVTAADSPAWQHDAGGYVNYQGFTGGGVACYNLDGASATSTAAAPAPLVVPCELR